MVEFSASMQDSLGIGRGLRNPEIGKGCGLSSLGKDLESGQESRSASLGVPQFCQEQQDR